MKWQLVMEAQMEVGEIMRQAAIDVPDRTEDKETRRLDIWQDQACMAMLNSGKIPSVYEELEKECMRRRTLNYYWQEAELYYKSLLVPKPEERRQLVENMHAQLGHLSEKHTLDEIKIRYFWHNRSETMNEVVQSCKQCQLAKRTGITLSSMEELHNIPVSEFFYRVALDTLCKKLRRGINNF